MEKIIHQLQIFLQTNVTNMPHSNCLAISSVFFFLFSSSFFFSTKATPIYTSHVCTDSTKNQPNTTFQTNLNLILSSLSSKATKPTQFYKTTIATETPSGDTLAAACHDCVTAAAADLKRWCPVQKEAIIWYDVCMVQLGKLSDENCNLFEQTTSSFVSLIRSFCLLLDRKGNEGLSPTFFIINHIQNSSTMFVKKLVEKASIKKEEYDMHASETAPTYTTHACWEDCGCSVAALLELCRSGGSVATKRVVKAPALAGLLQTLLFTGTKRARRKTTSLVRVFQRCEHASLPYDGLGVGYAFADNSTTAREASFAGDVSVPISISVPPLPLLFYLFS